MKRCEETYRDIEPCQFQAMRKHALAILSLVHTVQRSVKGNLGDGQVAPGARTTVDQLVCDMGVEVAFAVRVKPTEIKNFTSLSRYESMKQRRD